MKLELKHRYLLEGLKFIGPLNTDTVRHEHWAMFGPTGVEGDNGRMVFATYAVGRVVPCKCVEGVPFPAVVPNLLLQNVAAQGFSNETLSMVVDRTVVAGKQKFIKGELNLPMLNAQLLWETPLAYPSPLEAFPEKVSQMLVLDRNDIPKMFKDGEWSNPVDDSVVLSGEKAKKSGYNRATFDGWTLMPKIWNTDGKRDAGLQGTQQRVAISLLRRLMREAYRSKRETIVMGWNPDTSAVMVW